MQQSHAYNDASLALTTRILDIKARKNLSWQDLADDTGLSLAYVTAALLGQHPLPQDAAQVVGAKPGRRRRCRPANHPVARQPQRRADRPDHLPLPRDDPDLRHHLKALVHEQFGDGIISAINFKLDIKKVEDPEGGSRAVVTLDGKFLPLRPF
jgi:cyanate lyase